VVPFVSVRDAADNSHHHFHYRFLSYSLKQAKLATV
jgi:hypothetical protein